ncbi:MAG TPA: MFS transporter [Blastocatellia bacterium]|nr:MFS transporter [Blastocatellia bacterium]
MAPRAQRRWLTRSVLAIGVASLCSDLSHEMATTILPVFLSTEIGATALALGAIEGIADGLASYFKLVGGWWTDRVGRRKPVAVSGYLVTTVATASFALATTWVMVLASRGLAWMARGWRTPARNALLADSTEREFYGKVFGFERAADTIGAVVAPMLALALLEAGVGFRRIFLLTLIPGLAAAAAIAFFVSEIPRPADRHRRLIGDVKTLPRSFLLFLVIAGIFGLGQFAPTLLVLRATQLTGEADTAIALYVVFNIVQAASAYVIGSLTHRAGSASLLGMSYFLFAASAAGFAVAEADLLSLTALFALTGLAVGGIEAMEPTVAAELIPASVRGTGFGALAAANGLGDLLSSLVVGAMWTALGPAYGFGFAACCNLISVILLFAWSRRFAQRAKPRGN